LSDMWVIGIENGHLGRARVLPPDLMAPAKAS
jgi:hypothetical protein